MERGFPNQRDHRPKCTEALKRRIVTLATNLHVGKGVNILGIMQGCGFSGKRWANFETPAEQTPLLSRGRSEIETQFATFTSRDAVEESISGPRVTQEVEESRLPKFVWLMLKIMCVFWQKQLIVRRKCFHCQMNRARCLSKDDDTGDREKKLPSYFDADGQGYENAEAELEPCTTTDGANDQCKMCDSYWWNSEGNVKRYTEKEIGVQRWNHSRSSLLSVFLLVSPLVINVCDISLYIWFQHGQTKHSSIHILSYSIYLAELSFYPVMCLYSKLRTSTQGAAPRLSWSTALNARFIIKRMQFIDFRHEPSDKQELTSAALLPGVVKYVKYAVVFNTVSFQQR
ncbi:hypothetical protein HOLleu_18056 [Holothuria leucospilota]|uniref:Uncharacterized protein n=1 Tax=Holothuria leucospilota TaxID=206669 RepID=A0A9Q1H9J2_HOLLE|nr:hypothetical protein HOLleu_18056 [Holothuria leucospilota]